MPLVVLKIVSGAPRCRSAPHGCGFGPFPATIVPDLEHHLEAFSGHRQSGLVFPTEHGEPLRRCDFNKAVSWAAVREQIGVPTLHFHDLRHTGNTLAAQSGASLRDLMTRMGHDSPAGQPRPD